MRAFPGRCLASFLLGATLASPVFAAEPLKVVASFSILGDLVRQVGGEHVAITTLVGPNGDAHVYAPTPADARELAGAGLVVVNGLGFEGWLDRLVEASGYSGAIVTASRGVSPLDHADEEDGHGEAVGAEAEHEGEDGHAHAEEGEHAEAAEPGGGHRHGDIDPHAWQSVANALIYVENIAGALCEADAASCPDYRANAERYRSELRDIDAAIKAAVERIPPERRKVITTHDAFGYFSREYGIAFLAPQGVSTDADASAGDVAALVTQIRDEGVTALFIENVSDPRLMQQIASETGIRPGGELYSDALSDPGGAAPSYAEMMRHNAILLENAMLGS